MFARLSTGAITALCRETRLAPLTAASLGGQRLAASGLGVCAAGAIRRPRRSFPAILARQFVEDIQTDEERAD